jgi:hypothetical protein
LTRSQVLAIAVVTAFVAATPVPHRDTRSATPLPAESNDGGETFDGEHAGALFVGIRVFGKRPLRPIPYAVDDAIDLAHLLAFDPRVHLVSPSHMILALSGAPEKSESRERLAELRKAGARVTPARRIDIVHAVRERAARAGRSGFLVVSFATHGFVDAAGTQQLITASDDTLSKDTLTDIIDEERVTRSLILIDACKTRVAGGGRGVDARSFASTQLMKRMPRVYGQVILSTVNDAYDDPARRNGVFTEAVIDGLQCNASTIRDQVTAQTLGEYVERNVRGWIRMHVNRAIKSATQVSIDGEARNMPLAHCAPPSTPLLPLSSEKTMLRAFKEDRKSLLWQHDLGVPITHTAQADATIVAGTRKALIAFDVRGARTWSVHSVAPLQDLTAGDVFRKHHHDFIALWGSHIAIYTADGHLVATGEAPESLRQVAIYRTTTHHAPRIVAASAKQVFLFDPKKLAMSKPLWSAYLLPRSDSIASIRVIDHDRDSKAEIAVAAQSGATIYLDVKGHVVARTSNAVQLKLNRPR